MKAILVLLGFSIFMTGCSTTVVTEDYQAYLKNNQGQKLPALGYAAEYVVTPETKSHSYSIKSAMAGFGNSWVVKFGPVLESTLQSPDVQAAFKSLNEVNGTAKAPYVITFHLISYQFVDTQAKIEMQISATKAGKKIIDQKYQANGNSQGGKMFWGGAFAMKNAVQQSSKRAMDIILTHFLTDLKTKN